MSKLIYRKSCEHGRTTPHYLFRDGRPYRQCARSVDVVLDSEQVVFSGTGFVGGRTLQPITVQDILDALDKGDE